MNFKNTFILFFLIGIFFIIPVNAQIINGGFETGDFTGWTYSHAWVSGDNPYSFKEGSYSAAVGLYDGTAYISQDVSSTGYALLNLSKRDNTGFSWLYVYELIDGEIESIIYSSQSNTPIFHSINIEGYDNIRIRIINTHSAGTSWVDGICLSDYTPPIILMEFENEPIEVTTYAHLEVNLDDYWGTHANEHFYLSYDYYYKNISDYTIIDYNELELNSKNTVNMIPTYYPYFNQTGGCEIKASILYTYHDPVYTEEELGGIGYYISTVLVNSTYEPPEEPEEPEEPEIPDPEPEPDPEPDPPIPPTQPNGTGANQSINVSWTGEYYNAVNNTFGGLCSPIYNFTNWSLSPIYSLNNSIGEFNYHMNESFTQTAQDSSILYESINTIFSAIHPKIRNVITYYLIWVVLLIVLKKD